MNVAQKGVYIVVNAHKGGHAMALDDGAGGFGGDAEAFGDLSAAEVRQP